MSSTRRGNVMQEDRTRRMLGWVLGVVGFRTAYFEAGARSCVRTKSLLSVWVVLKIVE
jgi:hypothetical protein